MNKVFVIKLHTVVGLLPLRISMANLLKVKIATIAIKKITHNFLVNCLYNVCILKENNCSPIIMLLISKN